VSHVPRVLETPRLRLRSPTLADADAIFEYASDADVTRYMDWPTQTDPQSARDFLDGCLERLATGSELSWVITVPPSDRSIGMISCRMLEKAGLQREGTLRRWSMKPNIGPEPRDAFVFSKVRSAP